MNTESSSGINRFSGFSWGGGIFRRQSSGSGLGPQLLIGVKGLLLPENFGIFDFI